MILPYRCFLIKNHSTCISFKARYISPAHQLKNIPYRITGPAIVNILQPIPNTRPSFLYSIAGAATLFANHVIGTRLPAPPNVVIDGYILSPVRITLKNTSISVV